MPPAITSASACKPGVADLLGRQLHFPAKLHASALRGLHSGAGCVRAERTVNVSRAREA